MNGINTKEEGANNTAKELSKLTGQNVKAIYNPTEGMVKDIVEAGKERYVDNSFDNVSIKVARKFYSTLMEGKELRIVAHSQGAAVTADALMACEKTLIFDNTKYLKFLHPYLTPDEINTEVKEKVDEIMSKIEVITLGGAASEDKFPSSIKLVEVVNPKDLVPQVAGSSDIKTSSKSKSFYLKNDFTMIKDFALSISSPNVKAYLSRKSESLGNITYMDSNRKISLSSKDKIYLNTEHFLGAAPQLVKNVVLGLVNYVKGKDIIDYHLVDQGNEAYLKQNNVKNLMNNFGQQDL